LWRWYTRFDERDPVIPTIFMYNVIYDRLFSVYILTNAFVVLVTRRALRLFIIAPEETSRRFHRRFKVIPGIRDRKKTDELFPPKKKLKRCSRQFWFWSQIYYFQPLTKTIANKIATIQYVHTRRTSRIIVLRTLYADG